MNIPESEPWLQKARRDMKRRGHGDEWLSALKNRFSNGPDNATNAEVAAEITSHLSDEKADSAGSRGERIQKGGGAESDNGGDSGETEDDGALGKAFDPFAEREPNALELEF
jgi:hypothetical protein